MPTCPHCHKKLLAATPICPYCNRDIAVTCRNCKAYTDPQQPICQSCGLRWATEQEQPGRETVTATFASSVKPKVLASKIIAQHYDKFFADSPQGPLILGYLFGPPTETRVVSAAVMFAAVTLLVVEGYCTFAADDPKEPNRRYLRPQRERPWEGQLDSLEARILRESGDEVGAVLLDVVKLLARPSRTVVDQRAAGAMIGFAVGGFTGALIGSSVAPHYTSEGYDSELPARVAQLVHETVLPPHDPQAACHAVYSQMLAFYQHDPDGVRLLARTCVDVMVAVLPMRRWLLLLIAAPGVGFWLIL